MDAILISITYDVKQYAELDLDCADVVWHELVTFTGESAIDVSAQANDAFPIDACYRIRPVSREYHGLSFG